MGEPDFYTLADVAALLRVSKPTVIRCVEKQGLPALKLGERIEMSAWLDRVDGRKVFTVGEMRHDGEVTARAEGIFIRSDLLPQRAHDAGT